MHLQVNDGICAITIIGVEDEVTMEVSGIEAGKREAVSVTSQRGLGRGHGGPRRRGEQVVEQVVGDVARDAAALQQIQCYRLQLFR